jgi:hypothetical protein
MEIVAPPKRIDSYDCIMKEKSCTDSLVAYGVFLGVKPS